MSIDEGGMSFRATSILTKDPYPARCVAAAPLTGENNHHFYFFGSLLIVICFFQYYVFIHSVKLNLICYIE